MYFPFFFLYYIGGLWTFYLWILLATINSCYTSTWDLKMDWGLVRSNSRYYLLRDELVFHRTVSYLKKDNIFLDYSFSFFLSFWK